MKNIRTQEAYIVSGTSLLKTIAIVVMFLLAVFSISGLLTSLKPEFRLTSDSVHQASAQIQGDLLYQFMGWENHHFTGNKGQPPSPEFTNILFELSANINLDDPRSLLGRELPGFYQFDGKILVAGEGTNYTNMPIESAPPVEIMKAEREAALKNLDDIKKPGNSGTVPLDGKKKVYVYFTHNRESFLPYLEEEKDPNRAYHSKVNVTQIGDQLKLSLEAKGIGTFIDKTDVMGRLNTKGLGYGSAYLESRPVVVSAMSSNKELQYFIDIHRDSKRKAVTTKQINGKPYAKLAFVIGGKHANYERNLKLASDLHKLFENKYPGLSRGVIVKADEGSNGKYNQDVSGNALLIEFGGVDNTFDELNRSADALADVFSDFYWQAEKVNGGSSLPADKK